jgi:acetoin utilization protein AcuB
MRHDAIDAGLFAGSERPAQPARPISVADHMTRPVVTIGWEEPLTRADRLMEQRHIRHLPVVDADDTLIGILTDGDVREALESIGVPDSERAPATLIVGKVMTRDVVSVPLSCELAEAANLMHDRKLSALPVVDGGEVVGILSENDILALFASSLFQRPELRGDRGR